MGFCRKYWRFIKKTIYKPLQTPTLPSKQELNQNVRKRYVYSFCEASTEWCYELLCVGIIDPELVELVT